MKQIKIAHIITDLDIGGAEWMLIRTLRNFKNNRYEHFVISLLPRNSLCKEIEKEGFKVYLLNLSKKNFIASFIKLLYILKKEKPQIVHNYLFHADISGRIAARLTGVPIVISSLRNECIGGRWRERLLRMTDFCVNRVTAVSQNVADSHILKGTTKKNKMRIIYNGLEFKGDQDNNSKNTSYIRRDMNIGEDLFLLLTVANLELKKGHVFLFDALALLKEKGYRLKLLVVGYGKERKKLEGDIVSKGLADEIILAGKREDVQKLLVASDAFVLPSLWEGLPNALLEAMAAGLPVVATRVGGIPEVVTDNGTGLLVEPQNSDALAKAIERIMNEDELRRRLAQNAREYVRRNFDIKRTVAETDELYKELLGEHGKD
jgi:glycosyltransferase involved in cell wall biosynthesis